MIDTNFFITVWQVITIEISKMWWFVLLSIFTAAVIKTFQWDLKIRMLLQNKIKTGIVFATFVGMVSPLCSCGILPIALSLAVSGVPLPPLMSLLFSSPVMGPEALVITYGVLGYKFSVAKLVLTFVFSIFMGFSFYFLQKSKFFTEDNIRVKPIYDEYGQLKSSFEIACANDINIKTMTVLPRKSRFIFFLDRFKDMGLFIGSITLLAIAIEGIIYASVSPNFLKVLVGQDGFLSLIITALVGLMIPLNQIAAVPVIKGLMNLGMPFGLGITLMFSGAVTSIPSAIVLYKIFKLRVLIVYLFLCLFFSILAGAIFI